MKPTSRLHPPWSSGLLAALLALAAVGSARAIELGEASVLSQQGQRLKVAVPFGSGPNERVPVLRFAVTSVNTPDGQPAPAASDFTISKPDRRNVVYLQSGEPVALERLRIELFVAGNEVERISYDLKIPPQRFAASQADPAPAQQASAATRRPVRRVAQRRPATPTATARVTAPSPVRSVAAEACACAPASVKLAPSQATPTRPPASDVKAINTASPAAPRN